MADASLRLLLLLQHIPREPRYISSQQLYERLEHAGYPVSLRTVQRDLASLVEPIAQIIEQARGQVRQAVNSAMVHSYWHIGQMIVEHEQQGASRAEYGT